MRAAGYVCAMLNRTGYVRAMDKITLAEFAHVTR